MADRTDLRFFFATSFYDQQLMRAERIALAALSLVAMGCSSTSEQPTETRAHVRYTCCRAVDVNKPYRPGDVIELHWIAKPIEDASPESRDITLSAYLRGSFDDVATVKEGAEGQSVAPQPSDISAPDLVVPDTPTRGDRVSALRVPQSAAPGFYNLTFVIDDGGSRVSGSTVIRVVG